MLIGAIVVAGLAAAGPAHAWQPADLLRGPTAILNAPLVPFRSVVGGVQLARQDRSPGLQRKILLPPTLAIAGGGMGIAEGLIWGATGLADTVTGGALAIAPEDATHLSVAPLPPLFSANARDRKS